MLQNNTVYKNDTRFNLIEIAEHKSIPYHICVCVCVCICSCMFMCVCVRCVCGCLNMQSFELKIRATIFFSSANFSINIQHTGSFSGSTNKNLLITLEILFSGNMAFFNSTAYITRFLDLAYYTTNRVYYVFLRVSCLF